MEKMSKTLSNKINQVQVVVDTLPNSFKTLNK